MALTHLTIDRKTWANGDQLTLMGDPVESILLDSTGSRCCLGFLGKACGLEDDQLRGIGTPMSAGTLSTAAEFAKAWPKGVLDPMPPKVFQNNSQWTTIAVMLNDAPVRSDHSEALEDHGMVHYPNVGPGDNYRERLLMEHFKKIGIQLEFEG